MRNRPELALAATVVVGLAALLLVGLLDTRDHAFTLGVRPSIVAAELRPGDRVCQEHIDVPESFFEVEFQVGTFRREGAPLALTVRERDDSGTVIGRGSLAGGYPDVTRQRVEVGEVGEGQQVAVCFESVGPPKLALYGNAAIASPTSTLRIEGKEAPTDVTVVFHQADERSLLGELPRMFERAALFKGGWVGPWAFWLLAAAVLVLVPLALAHALRGLPHIGS